MSSIIGSTAKLTINGTEFCFKSADPEASVDTKDVSCTGVNGTYKQKITGQKQSTLKVSMYYDATSDTFANPPDIVEGETLTEVKLYPDRNDAARYWRWPSFLVTKVSMKIDVNDVVMVDWDGENDGIYYEPTG